ncbi:MAG: hypothetical protein OXT67_04230 [Zetaproteobacteria bacterium]|nr:hypothetical protein [Zetaproteobacteria bacterium]
MRKEIFVLAWICFLPQQVLATSSSTGSFQLEVSPLPFLMGTYSGSISYHPQPHLALGAIAELTTENLQRRSYGLLSRIHIHSLSEDSIFVQVEGLLGDLRYPPVSRADLCRKHHSCDPTPETGFISHRRIYLGYQWQLIRNLFTNFMVGTEREQSQTNLEKRTKTQSDIKITAGIQI